MTQNEYILLGIIVVTVIANCYWQWKAERLKDELEEAQTRAGRLKELWDSESEHCEKWAKIAGELRRKLIKYEAYPPQEEL